MKIFSFIFVITFLASCNSATKMTSVRATETLQVISSESVGKSHKTQNRNNPYIYENGYGSISIAKRTYQDSGVDKTVNVLKFNAVLSASYTQVGMFEKFGHWTKQSVVNMPSRNGLPAHTKLILTWEGVQLLPNNPTLFTVMCDGDENFEEIYASAIVLNSNFEDQLTTESPEREAIVRALSDAIVSIKNPEAFYAVTRDLISRRK